MDLTGSSTRGAIDNGATVYLTRKDDNDLSNKKALYRKKSDFDNRIKLLNNNYQTKLSKIITEGIIKYFS